MLAENNRAFKEWAIACDALRDGRQILLIRKGGIREEGGVFTMSDREFLLLPTFEHQKADLVHEAYLLDLATRRAPPDLDSIRIDTYGVVDTILTAGDEAQVNQAAEDTIWNSEYVRQRFDFNAYDPLYLVVIRAYRLAAAVTIPLLADYVGCRSWVTLDRSLSTAGAFPVMSDAEFMSRRARLLAAMRR